jgi:hypothetical protein
MIITRDDAVLDTGKLPDYLRREILVAAYEKPHIYRGGFPSCWLARGWEYAGNKARWLLLHDFLKHLDCVAPSPFAGTLDVLGRHSGRK